VKEYRSSLQYIREQDSDNCFYSARSRSGYAQPLFFFHDIIGIENVKKTARYLAGQRVNVLITGETGTGKELFASAMHNQSIRNNAPFVAVNCAAIPRTLFESELFGYKKGAFTDARSDRIGRIEYANGGTIFFDEIGDMPYDIQSKLLRVLETKKVCPLGANEDKQIDVRFFFATNQDLQALVKRRLFRADLYYRLSAPAIHIPALRDRKAEIPELVPLLLSRIRNEYDIMNIKISDEALGALIQYDFPGNVRELEGLLRNACVKCNNGIIKTADLSLECPIELSFNEQIKEYKIRLIYDNYLFNNGDINKICKNLKISKRQVYRYLKLVKELNNDLR